ncbi:hypothetical protein Patl1_21231 [Pistacia atlantica]|uniref:Uncharacterized protein n=1 Tax=Pistacia atlantica TaxID=434234 RepID=A0ACC1BLS6_9ROSI|nr:hypothetical protein Patl1_21231 [Pistacia atlantica]
MNSVTKELLNGIVYATSAHLVWRDLQERFDKINGSRIFQIHREIVTLVQGTHSISTYFSKLKLLWDEYSSIIQLPTCECSMSKTYVNYMQNQKLLQFLMGLNETYLHARSQILMMNPLPSVNQAYSMLVTEESQRNLISTALTVLYSSSNTSQHSSKTKKNWSIICEHCNVRGHKKDNYYRLIGYPADFKFTKKKFSNQSSASNVTSDTQDITPSSTESPTAPVFSKEQHAEILKLLQKEPSMIASTDTNVNMAGIHSYFSSLHHGNCWILDTGASHHMTASLDKLTNLMESTSQSSVRLPNGHQSSVSHIGSYMIGPNPKLTNVLFVLDFKFNRSIAKLTRGLEVFCVFLSRL